MQKEIQSYLRAKNNILMKFGCKQDYPIKPMINVKWMISGDDGVFFLTYWDENNERKDFAIAKSDGSPMIFETKDYSMVVAIDCIKIAFVFKNINK